MKGVRTKKGSKTRVAFVRVGNKTYEVPSHRVKQFRAAMGVPKRFNKSMMRNQWDTNPHS